MPLIPQRIFKTRLNPEQGFVLPLVLGIGVITILLGVMMMERSSQNRIAAIAQKANAQSTAAAEHGVTQLQALLNRYPRLATACSDSGLSSACGSPPSWKTIKNKTLEPCSTDDGQPIWLQPYANQEWKNSTTDVADGQFRVFSYKYDPDASDAAIGTGTLVVEGQINPNDSLRTATTKIETSFKITRAPKAGAPPGLWIQDNQAPETSRTALLTNVRDSTCPAEKVSNPSPALQGQIQSPYAYQSTPGLAFPKLPLEGIVPISNTSFGSNTIDPIEGPTPSLPSPTQPQSGSALTHNLKANNNGQSINLTSLSEVLEVGKGGETIVLNLEGGLTLTGGGRIRIASDTQLTVYTRGSTTLTADGTNSAIELEPRAKLAIYTYGPANLAGSGTTPAIKLAPNSNLVVYAHGPVNLGGNETAPVIQQEKDPNDPAWTPSATRVQIYVYQPETSTDSPYDVNLGGNETPLFLSLFAPYSKVTSAAKVQGTIWANSWEGRASAAIAQAPGSPADLKLQWPSRISPITAWTVNPP
jgi:Tfp pilus assembly protein PilX